MAHVTSKKKTAFHELIKNGPFLHFGLAWLFWGTLLWYKGYKVRSVSMYMTFPPVYPVSVGSWAVTQSVWASCVFPVRASPNTSVIDMDSTPPPRILLTTKDQFIFCLVCWLWFSIYSIFLLPVVRAKSCLRCSHTSSPVRKQPAVLTGHIFPQASLILFTLSSLNPLRVDSFFLVHIWTPGTKKNIGFYILGARVNFQRK